MEMTLAELARAPGGRTQGDGRCGSRGVAGIREAGAGDLTFLANPKYEEFLGRPPALPRSSAVPRKRQRPRAAIRPSRTWPFVEALRDLLRPARRSPRGVHPTALIDAGAQARGATSSIGPYVVVGDGVRHRRPERSHGRRLLGGGVATRAELRPLPERRRARGDRIGDRVVIHAGAVIGDDGFGFARGRGSALPEDPAGRQRGDRRRRRDRREHDHRPRHHRRDPDRPRHEDRQPGHDRPQRGDRRGHDHLRPGRHLGQHASATM